MSNYVDLSEDKACEAGETIKHTDYIYDIGEFPVKSSNLQRFRDSYHTSRPEYSGHAFKMKLNGEDEPRTVRVPRNVAREIHLLCEAKAHPLTFHQKLQPNYISGNTSHPNKVGKTQVETVVYFNGIQNAMKAPKYIQDKCWAMQSAMFEEKMQLKKLNSDGHPTVKDLDYSKQVAKRMFQHDKTKKKPKKSKGGVDHKTLPSRIQDSEESLLHRVMNGLPTIGQLMIDENRPEDWEDIEDDELDSETERAQAAELAEQNATRNGKHQIKRVKLTQKSRASISTNNDARSQRVTRSMEKAKAAGAGAGRRRKSDPGGVKRKLIDENDDEEVQLQSSEHTGDGMADDNASFDLFSFQEEKKDWDDHPAMEKLVKLGRSKMEGVGFSSPREGMGSITIQRLAKAHKVKLPKKRKQCVDVLVRALAIEKLMAQDPTTSMYYEDKKKKS